MIELCNPILCKIIIYTLSLVCGVGDKCMRLRCKVQGVELLSKIVVFGVCDMVLQVKVQGMESWINDKIIYVRLW